MGVAPRRRMQGAAVAGGWLVAALLSAASLAGATSPSAPRPVAGATGPSDLGASAPTAPSAAPSTNPYADATDASSAVRQALARRLAADRSARGLVLLWLLSTDPLPEVAVAGAAAAVARCSAEPPAVCTALLRFYLHDATSPAAALARDALWILDPAAAFQNAPADARLAAVARLTARLPGTRPEPATLRLLRLLAEDPDPDVQQAAAAALMSLER